MIQESLSTILTTNAPTAAKRLLGCELERTLPTGKVARVRIVETEAYDADDPGSHSFRGISNRNRHMFGPPGFAYVYLIYGIHYCLNVVTGPENRGEAVLIRAVQPLLADNLAQSSYDKKATVTHFNGPAKLCKALAIDVSSNGHDLAQPPLKLILKPAIPNSAITQTTRIGLSKGIATPWRFYLTGNPNISRR